MFKAFSRIFVLVVALMFGSVVSASASITDINNDVDKGNQNGWNKQSTLHYYIKTYFGKWNKSWHNHKYHYEKKENQNKPADQNNDVQEKPKPETTEPSTNN